MMTSESYAERKAKGRRALMVWLDRDLHQALRIMAVSEERRMVDVVADALAEYLAKRTTVVPSDMFDRLASSDNEPSEDGGSS